jgi:hypothetical protein
MKYLRFLLPVVLMSLSTVAFAQSAAQSNVQADARADAQVAAKSDAQIAALKAFAQLKTLAGNWTGQAAMGPEFGMESAPVHVSLRVTSGGTALMHEMTPEGKSVDPSRGDDDPITMLYVDGDRLMLTHYCDSGKNRPRMAGKLSPDGKTVEFDFLDLTGSTEYGHMQHAVFTFIDANHHTEEWTYMMPGDKPGHAHIDLKRAQ